MVRVRRFVPRDYMEIQRRKFDQITFDNFPHPEEIAANLANGIAFTAVTDAGDIVVCGGVMYMWEGVGEAWVVGSKLVDLYPFSFAKIVKRKLHDIIDEMKLKRVQTTVDAEYETSQNWLEWMGFKNEGKMREYISGRDFFRYALIMED